MGHVHTSFNERLEVMMARMDEQKKANEPKRTGTNNLDAYLCKDDDSFDSGDSFDEFKDDKKEEK